MKEQNIKIIREACIKANPEIVELKFGCEFRHGFSKATYLIEDDDFVYIKKLHVAQPIDEINKMGKGLITDDKIIGRPIRLADVLMALDEREHNYFLDMGGMFVNENTTMDGDAPSWTKYGWNLRKDSLTEQSEETLQFLADLLK